MYGGAVFPPPHVRMRRALVVVSPSAPVFRHPVRVWAVTLIEPMTAACVALLVDSEDGLETGASFYSRGGERDAWTLASTARDSLTYPGGWECKNGLWIGRGTISQEYNPDTGKSLVIRIEYSIDAEGAP